MAKQNADTHTIQNQNPDAVVVFLRLDDRGRPIRDMTSMIVPDISDINNVSLAMGKTGATGEFSLNISNTNNKYFVPDDMKTELENLAEGTIKVGTTEDNATIYNTLSADVMWSTPKDFLNNRAYRRLFSSEDGQDIYLYFQNPDPTTSYNENEIKKLNVPEDIKDMLRKGILRYRVIDKNNIESYAKTDFSINKKSPVTSKDSTTSPESSGPDIITPGESRPANVSFYDSETDQSFTQRNSNGDVEDVISASSASLSTGTDTTSETSSLLFSKEGPTHTKEVDVPLEEAASIFMISDKQSAFFEKYGGQLEHGRCVFEPMQLCVIFLPRRFRDESDPNDLIISFVGFVNNVQDSFSGGTNQSLTIKGSDVTKLMRITQANINPSLFTEEMPETGYKVWQSVFGGLEGWEIIKILTVGGVISANDTFIYGTGSHEVEAGVSPGVENIERGLLDNSISKNELLSSVVMSTKSQQTGGEDKLDKLFFSPRTVHIQTLPFDNSPVVALQDYGVFKRIFGMSFGNWESEYTDHLQLANEVSALTNYEFYADAFGDIWYHQPRFHNYHILTADNPEVYVLRDEDIINSNFTESDEGVITSVYMTGSPNIIASINKVITKMADFYEDPGLVLKYGRRMVAVSHPYVVDAGSINYFLRSYLIRVNAGRFVGKVTIIGRPEIKVHMPVYIPHRNMVYYITQIDHSLDFGNQFTTTLTLKYGRKPWEVLPEILEYNATANSRLTPQKTDRSKPETVNPDIAVLDDRDGDFRSEHKFT